MFDSFQNHNTFPEILRIWERKTQFLSIAGVRIQCTLGQKNFLNFRHSHYNFQ
jgi:hypothetical protein